jgi:Type IX secretion system protein PorV
MNIRHTKINFLVILFSLPVISLYAQTSNENNPITTAVPFLRAAADARTAAMGEASVATNPDVNSIFYNGGKTVFNEKKYGIGLNYTPMLTELEVKNLFQLSLSGYYKLDTNQAISFGVRNFSKGTFLSVDATGQELNSVRANDIAVEAGYSRRLSERMGVGLTLRYIGSKLTDNTVDANYKNGSTVAADIAAFYRLNPVWNFGLALTNLGGKMKYGGISSFIPATITIGTNYNEYIDADNKLSLALDFSKLLVPTPPDPSNTQKVTDYEKQGVVSSWFKSFGDAPGGGKEELREVQVALGAEYSYKDMFNVRAGYFSESKYKGNRNYVTVGAGLVYKATGFNFAYLIPTGDNTVNNAFKNAFRLSLLFNFNNVMSSK